MSAPDTIVAAATPPGRGGIGIVRVSGALVPEIARHLLKALPEPRMASLGAFLGSDGSVLDTGLALYFPAPSSYTGEHVLELHGHGGPVVIDLLVRRAVQLGARLAQPGEFTQRAFLNDKLDLAQAEAVADLIDSGSQAAAHAALRSLQGEFSAIVQGLTEAVIDLRVRVEAAIDFPEEEIDLLAEAELGARLEALLRYFDSVAQLTQQGRLLRDGMTVVIAGAPNAGKSSLMNRLAGYDAAIVTDVPGTTRDVLRERVHLDGMPLHLIDTAGLREVHDAVEAEGVRRARAEMTRADRVLFVVDCASDPQASSYERERTALPPDVPVTLVMNKSDLVNLAAQLAASSSPPTVRLSARTGAGLDLLREHLKRCMGFMPVEAGSICARRRHLDALARARAHIETGAEHLRTRRAGELLAEELRAALGALGEITGEFSSEDLLTRIFSTFCIGK
ncbi:MAG TPA: tRNA uridine-5-carboxymethylaminomethyl(34) synthesis GTPase MnmE [Steroidobacteraceae bacterium]|jgi:tRNA modification GTPase